MSSRVYKVKRSGSGWVVTSPRGFGQRFSTKEQAEEYAQKMNRFHREHPEVF